jgi:hypothetical protein
MRICIDNTPHRFTDLMAVASRDFYEEVLSKARRDCLYSPRYRYFWGGREMSAAECYQRLVDLDYCPLDVTVL